MLAATFVASLAAVAFFSTAASAQSLTDIPTCAVTCLTQVLPSSPSVYPSVLSLRRSPELTRYVSPLISPGFPSLPHTAAARVYSTSCAQYGVSNLTCSKLPIPLSNSLYPGCANAALRSWALQRSTPAELRAGPSQSSITRHATRALAAIAGVPINCKQLMGHL